MAAKLGFEHQQDHGREQQEDRGVADGEQVQREDGQEHHQGAEGAGNDGAGGVEFEVDEQRAADEKKQGDVGIDEPVEQVFAEGGLHTVDLGSGEV